MSETVQSTDPLAPASTVPASTDAKEKVELSPDTSDVPPVYLAIVAPDDAAAVMDLIALVPANKQSTVPTAYRRKAGEWVSYPQIMDDLRSATPPPVVKLDATTYKSVLEQMEGSVTASAYPVDHTLMVLFGPDTAEMERRAAESTDVFALMAAGGLDKNRGQAERLRQYWTHGEGAAKIRWGQPGDWKRCVRHLSKYLGVRAKGYCQLRHKDALGYYTSTHAEHDRAVKASGGFAAPVESYGAPVHTYREVPTSELEMPLPKIRVEHDDLYDYNWEPPVDVVHMLGEMAGCDEHTYALLAGARPPSAYNIDKNRGNAERLRRYWTKGKGAAKIRWNTGGDWKRCVRYLSKYLGPRAKGYCALRHKEVTGMWTGDKPHREMYGWGKNQVFGNQRHISTSMEILEAAELSAKAAELRDRMRGIVASGEVSQGSHFAIPLVLPEDTESGDGRIFKTESITLRDLPLPLLWQIKTGEGHSGSVVVGRIDHMERTEAGIGNARGVFDTGKYGAEAERLVRSGFLRGVSADLDRFEAEEKSSVKEDLAEAKGKDKKIKNDKLVIEKARVMAVTIVPKPAFQECSIALLAEDPTIEPQEDTMIPNGVYVDDADSADAQALVACGAIVASIPVNPPTEWFDNPKLTGPTPLTVTDDGRVFGHIAAWHVDHIGLSYGTKPPRSRSNYGYFHTGVLRTENGTDIPVGQLTLAGGHATLEASAAAAAKHYDDTGSAIADVHAGEDRYGIYVAGALRSSASPEQVRALRASAPSGDWRPIKGGLELVAVCQVNVPGFPIARARVASGQVMALVAAGAATLAKMKSDPVAELTARLSRLEDITAPTADELAAKKLELSSRFADLNTAQEYDDQFTMFSRERRQKLAQAGKAMKDGSFPIVTEDDLKNAIHAYGRARDKGAARKHIMKRARALKKWDAVPQEWKTASDSEAITASVESMRERITKLRGTDEGK